jgi:hypothetical protein
VLNPFLQRARSFPLKLIVDIHSYCNARCTMCPYPRYAARQSQGKMDWTLYQNIVEEMARIGSEHDFTPMMTYCYMAEPFLADDLDRYVRYGRDRGIDIYLNTNAAPMTPEKIEALLQAGFAGKIHISIHGVTPSVYERITGLDYELTLKNVHYLLEHYDNSRICIRGVDDNWPGGEKQRWFDYWRNWQVELEYLNPISRCGGIGRLLPRKLKDKEQVKLYGCREHHPLVEMVILYDGRAVMCCQDMGRELIWGDVSQDGISGVWNAPRRIEAVRKLYSGAPSERSFICARCEQALSATGWIQSLAKATWRKLVAG